MSLYDIAYVTWPVLLALLVAVPSALWLANRRAWKNGWDVGFDAGWEEALEYRDEIDEDAKLAESIILEDRLKPYAVRVDPPSASY